MSARPLPRSTPSEQQTDAAGIRSFIDALDAAPGVEAHSLMVVRHGQVIAEGWWAPYGADRPHLLYSLSKSFTSTALGFAVAEGVVDLDATVLSYFPELDAGITDARSRRIRVRHVAAMASGHLGETHQRAESLDPVDLVRGFLLIPPDEEPGSVFAYNQPCTFALAAILQRVSGQPLTDYLRPRLFDPIGIGAVGWVTDRSGREIGYSGLHATTEDVAKLGLLYLQDGRVAGEHLLPARWVAEATASHVANPAEPNPDWRQGYGFQFWMARHGYRGDGAYGQFCVVLPEHDTVIVTTAQSEDMQAMLDAAWRHLLPALGAGGDPAADQLLTERLAGLSIPVVAGGALPAAQRFTAAPGNDQPRLTEVELTADGAIRLTDSGATVEAHLGHHEWVVTDAIAANGAGRVGLLHVDLIFVETPHRLHLRCDPATGTFEARWMTRPLHDGPLAELRMPRRD